MASAGPSEPLVPMSADDSPGQIGSPPTLRELAQSRATTEDFVSGIITHVYEVPGEPSEAALDSRLGSLQPGSIHFWSGVDELDGKYDQFFLTNRSFDHLMKDEDTDVRTSLMTLTYERKPCPHLYEEHIRVVTRPVQEWYSRERVPDPGDSRLTRTFASVSIPAPRVVLIRKYPKIKISATDLMAIAQYVGHVSKDPYLGLPANAWLFEGLHARQLYGVYGNRNYSESYYEITTFIEADPQRLHEYWYPKNDRGVPVKWDQGVAREDLHHRLPVFPVLPDGVDIGNLVIPTEADLCAVPARS